MKIKPILSVTEQFFDDRNNHLLFLTILEKSGVSSKELTEYFTTGMRLADDEYDLSCLSIPRWSDIFDNCQKEFIRMKKVNNMGVPVYKIEDFYLANYMCLVFQYENPDFAGYVRAWFLDKINYIDKFEM